MKKRLLVLTATAVGAIGLMAGPAAAGGNGYGKAWKDCFGAYGQSVQAVAKNQVAGHSLPAVGVNIAYPVHAPLCAS